MREGWGGGRPAAVKRVLVAVTAVVVVAARLLLMQSVRTHERYGEWGIAAPATPLRITVLGRDYDRGDLAPSATAPDDVDRLGETDGGGTILVPAGSGGGQPVIVYVQDEEGRVWTYGLVGGP